MINWRRHEILNYDKLVKMTKYFRILYDKQISTKLKGTIYRITIRLVMLYVKCLAIKKQYFKKIELTKIEDAYMYEC